MQLRRAFFLWSIRSGIRALANRVAHTGVTWNESAERPVSYQPYVLQHGSAAFRMRFWRRRVPDGGAPDHCYGLLSARMMDPPIPPRDYQRVCRLGHFGDGHFEAAVEYCGSICRIYAVKNVARDYCHLAGLEQHRKSLTWGSPRREPFLIYELMRAGLETCFERVRLAEPEECVRLAVCSRWVRAAPGLVREKTLQRYRSLERSVNRANRLIG